MATKSAIRAANERLAEQINQEARSDPRSPYAGKFIGLANGQLVVVADNLDDVAKRLEQVEPDPANTFCLEAGLDYDEVQEIWNS
jgi:hypothetical protein